MIFFHNESRPINSWDGPKPTGEEPEPQVAEPANRDLLDVRDVFGGHHIWCNGDNRSPVKGCRWCDPDGDGKRGLWASYPYTTGAEANGLMAKHFPQNIKRPGTGYEFPEDDKA